MSLVVQASSAVTASPSVLQLQADAALAVAVGPEDVAVGVDRRGAVGRVVGGEIVRPEQLPVLGVDADNAAAGCR